MSQPSVKKNRNTLIFHGKKLKTPCPTPKMEYRHLSIVCDRLINIFQVTAHTWWPFHPLDPERGPYRDDRNPKIVYCIQRTFICGNKMPTRCNRGFYCGSYCLLNMFRTPLRPSSGAQEYYTVVAACGFQVAGLVCS